MPEPCPTCEDRATCAAIEYAFAGDGECPVYVEEGSTE